MAASILQVNLFGSIELSLEGAALPAPPSPKARSLLGYLLVHHDRSIPRDRLLGLFWPDRSDSAARRALSHALWQIRRALGPAADRLITDQDAVFFQLLPGDKIDVEEFQRLCMPPWPLSPVEEINHLRQAIALYRADFLEDIYDDWALLERERLRESYLRTLERLVTLYKHAGDYAQALSYAQRLIRADPLREEVHSEIMRLYHLLGRSRNALQQYETLRRILKKELGTEPMSATTALVREIARQADLAVPHLPVPANKKVFFSLEEHEMLPLVGRKKERATLLAHLDVALSGRGGLVLIEGEAGVGKTRLLHEIAQDASWRGVQVLWGRSTGFETSTPYQPLADALQSALSPLRAEQLSTLIEPIWLREVAALVPSLAEWLPDLGPAPPLEPGQAQDRFLEALTRTLLGLGRITPYLLILEDLQWADEATFQALLHLVPHLEHSRLLILASYREYEVRERQELWERLRALDRVAGGRRVRLSRLSREATAELLQRSLGLSQVNPRFGLWLYQESEGNPLFVLEILRSLYSEGILYQDEQGVWRTPWDEGEEPPEGLLPSTVEQVIQRRLAHLGKDAQRVLSAAAVLGEEVTFRSLHITVDLPQGTLLSALDELRRRHLLVEDATGYRFSHDKVRQVVYEAMNPATRRALHHRAAIALRHTLPRYTALFAHHAEQGEMWLEAVQSYRQLGAYATQVHAYTVALDYYARALALADRAALSNAELFELLREHEMVLSTLGRREEQMADLARMAQLAGDALDLQVYVHRRRALVFTQTSRYPAAVEEAQQMLRLAREMGSPDIEAKALLALGRVLGVQGRRHQAISHLESAIRIAREQNDRSVELEARATAASAYLTVAAYDLAYEHAVAALRLAEAIGQKRAVAGMWSTLGRIETLKGNFAQAEGYYRRSLEICEAIGYRQGKVRNLLNWGLILAEQDRVGQALERYQEALRLYRSLKDRRGEALALGNLADLYHTYLGDDETASRYAQEALNLCEAIGSSNVGYHLLVLGGIARRRQAYREAEALLQRSLAAMQAVRKRSGEVAAYLALAALALDLGRPQQALEHLDAAAALCQDGQRSSCLARILAKRGEVLLALGQPDAALEATSQAMSWLHSGVEQGYLIPFVHYRALKALGRYEEAWEALKQAHQKLMEALEGVPEAQRRMGLERVPSHRAILAAWEATRPQRVTLPLPVASAPTGRPLRDDEWVEVTWTVSAPEDEVIRGKVARRRHRLLRLLREAAEQGAAPTVQHLARALDASARTIKRDIAVLRAEGHSVSTRGRRS